MKIKGSQVVTEVLLDHGVDIVFGYPGGTAINIYDELYRYKDKIKHVLTADEAGASHAADGYARTTGKTGVVFATSGPGATNLVTGLATAFMDSIPMVAITINVQDYLIGSDAFQEICITGVTLPITKHNYFVNDVNELESALREAFLIANSGRKGPVLVDITKDVTEALVEYSSKAPYPLRKNPEPKDTDVENIVKLINHAERPVLYIGQGAVAAEAAEEVRELVSKADIPAVHTLMAAGVVRFDDPHNLGMIGMHGTVAANRAVDKADLVIAVGGRFSDRVALNPKKWAQKAKIVQIDIDRSEINKNVKVDCAARCDIKDFLDAALPLVEKKKRTEWNKTVSAWKVKEFGSNVKEAKLHPHEIIKVICDNTDDETIFVTDVGQHQMWAAQFIEHKKPRKFITSGGLGTMGFGYGAAIGAQMAFPENRVIHITGDGSFHMNMNEACTAVTQGLPIITVIMDNRTLGMVYQWQTLLYDKRYSNTKADRVTDFVKVAEGFGAKGFKAETPEELEAAFKAALKEKGPCWIACSIDREERVLPMIPGGKTVDDIIVD